MLFTVNNILQVIFINSFVNIDCLVQLKSDKYDQGKTEYYVGDVVKTLISVLKLINSTAINNFTQNYAHILLADQDEKDMLNDVIKMSRVDTKNDSRTNMISVINDVLDGNVKSDEDNNKTLSSEEIKVDDVVRFINEFENLKKEIYTQKYNTDIDKEILAHADNGNIVKDVSIENKTVQGDEELSDIEFWEPTEQSGRRIYQGDRTKIKYFPFMASVHFFQKFQCGGAIIKSDLIISAASCLQLAWNNRFFRENPSFLSVRIGSNYYNGGGENIGVLEVYFHPEYNPRNLRNNLCLMRLVRRIKFRKRGKKVKKIDIDRNAHTLPSTTDGVTVVGWGARGSSNIIGNIWTNRLSFSVLDFYPLQECQDIYSSEYVTKKNFCAGFFSKGGGACNRDVGGPGVVNGRLTGVISFGSPVCGAPNAPTVFTKIGYYADWIEEIMEQEVPYAKAPTTLRPPHHPFKNPIVHTSPKPTTFKINPVVGAHMKPVPLSESDTLRMNKDEAVLRQLLNAMRIHKNIERNNEEAKLQTLPPTTEKTPVVTTEYVSELSPIVTQLNLDDYTTEKHGHTVMEEDFGVNKEKELEKDLAKLMDEIDLKQIINSNEVAEKKAVINDREATTVQREKNQNAGELGNMLQKDDSVLTLLYLSDSEKKNAELEDLEHGGLSIPTDTFKDMTFKANEAELFDLLPKSDLYDILSEAILEDTNKKVDN